MATCDVCQRMNRNPILYVKHVLSLSVSTAYRCITCIRARSIRLLLLLTFLNVSYFVYNFISLFRSGGKAFHRQRRRSPALSLYSTRPFVGGRSRGTKYFRGGPNISEIYDPGDRIFPTYSVRPDRK